ncbi:MAG: NADH-quinone oxidoreductase subunit F, partial [Myxococcaceae bacterium]|nr:NADH-quinone oxidoreductase subunit F [Myxococcaceae bacterium]
MSVLTEKVMTRDWDKPGQNTLAGYKQRGGYAQLKRVLDTMQPAQITDEVKKSNLRGRGGAGFPTGLKWSFVPSLEKNTKPRYLAINADESEPGTAKDRFILEYDPHLLLEGIAIACYALGAHTCYIYARGEFKYPSGVLDKAIAEAYADGIFGKKLMGKDFELNVYQVRGAGAYICGEETALL